MSPRNVLSIPLLAAALCACSPQSTGAADAGARIYSGNCVPCHQQNGAGIPGE